MPQLNCGFCGTLRYWYGVSDNFTELVQRLYDGDARAAEQIVREHEPEVRRIVRSRLRDPRLRRILDSVDVCQSVFGRFFLQVSMGKFELNSPQDLVKLLTRMTTNKIIDKHRSESSQRRLIESQQNEIVGSENAVSRTEAVSPSAGIIYEELMQLATEKLTKRELEISKLRNRGLTWLEVSRELGESPQALRKRFERACGRLSKELGLE